MKYVMLLAFVLVGACKGAPSCEEALKKAAKQIHQLNDREAMSRIVAECVKDEWSDELRKCVADVRDEPDLMACGMREKKRKQSGSPSDDYMKRSKATEAGEQLNAIGKLQKRSYGDNSQYTQGESTMLPSAASGTTGCCGGRGGTENGSGSSVNNKCTAEPSKFKADPVWSAMGFSVGVEGAYRYSYRSNSPTSFTAYAIGDTDCDGIAATFTLQGTIDAAGNPSVNLTKPPSGVY